jgi:hypothetical protein
MAALAEVTRCAAQRQVFEQRLATMNLSDHMIHMVAHKRQTIRLQAIFAAAAGPLARVRLRADSAGSGPCPWARPLMPLGVS